MTLGSSWLAGRWPLRDSSSPISFFSRHTDDGLWALVGIAKRFPRTCGRVRASMGPCVPSMFDSLEVKVLCPGLVETKG